MAKRDLHLDGDYPDVPTSGEDYSKYGAGEYDNEENYDGVPLGEGPEDAIGPGSNRN
jgi:hypothetical protein